MWWVTRTTVWFARRGPQMSFWDKAVAVWLSYTGSELALIWIFVRYIPQCSVDPLEERVSFRHIQRKQGQCWVHILAPQHHKWRQSAHRAFCPPDKLTPWAPTSVQSPSLGISRSALRAQASMTCSYLSSSKGEPKNILSLMERCWSHGDWAAYEIQCMRLFLSTLEGFFARVAPPWAWSSPQEVLSNPEGE